ncbi:hypothetical protein [Bradyrhizobium sp. LHD-71]|uniref:hypothetical protein n=1 Tax=Bradyrhizobium sp. LHD-71 TaxID=3072141 RepID=UPI00280E8F12|nr:hypothetical protein [Bradyrhizobium sp. LHD-71]MDQ8729490.1 hypothetical protein [Bradyrhizobium sp. LHD-71]
MIDKDYFRRQAKTLRKMVKVAQDRTVADRLSEMAADFEERAKDRSDDLPRFRPTLLEADGDEGHG